MASVQPELWLNSPKSVYLLDPYLDMVLCRISLHSFVLLVLLLIALYSLTTANSLRQQAAGFKLVAANLLCVLIRVFTALKAS